MISIPVKTQQSHGEKTEPSAAKQNNCEVKKMPCFITQLTYIFFQNLREKFGCKIFENLYCKKYHHLLHLLKIQRFNLNASSMTVTKKFCDMELY
jgi:hypothetical protein